MINQCDHFTCGACIGTSVISTRPEKGASVAFSGTKDQLIATGLVTPGMFPEGRTPTGRERNRKSSPKSSPIRWLVSKYGNRWDVHFYDCLGSDELIAFEEGKQVAREEWKRGLRALVRRWLREDD